MLYHTLKLLSEDNLSLITSELMKCPDWIDGAKSARGSTKKIKRNIQLSPKTDAYKKLNRSISDLLMNETSVLSPYIYPKKIINLLFSRTSTGMYYGKHLDISHTPEGRRDYSFTLFLSNPADYRGGELILDIPPEQKAVKLDAGSIIIYPTKYMHEVKEVTEGERMVCVGWIESLIKDDVEREILSDVYMALAQSQNNDKVNFNLTLNLAFQKLKRHFAD